MGDKTVIPIQSQLSTKNRYQLSPGLPTGLIHQYKGFLAIFMKLFELLSILEVGVDIDKLLINAHLKSNLNN